MALKDTLERLQQQRMEQEQWEKNKPQLIRAWQEAIGGLFDTIRGYLDEYRSAGSMTFTEGRTDLSEEALGRYVVKVLNIVAGPITVVVAPVGAMIVGATGRVDMYRQGRVGEFERVVLLRQRKSASENAQEWKITFPMATSNARERKGATRSERAPLTKATLEKALEFLLARP